MGECVESVLLVVLRVCFEKHWLGENREVLTSIPHLGITWGPGKLKYCLDLLENGCSNCNSNKQVDILFFPVWMEHLLVWVVSKALAGPCLERLSLCTENENHGSPSFPAVFSWYQSFPGDFSCPVYADLPHYAHLPHTKSKIFIWREWDMPTRILDLHLGAFCPLGNMLTTFTHRSL